MVLPMFSLFNLTKLLIALNKPRQKLFLFKANDNNAHFKKVPKRCRAIVLILVFKALCIVSWFQPPHHFFYILSLNKQFSNFFFIFNVFLFSTIQTSVYIHRNYLKRNCCITGIQVACRKHISQSKINWQRAVSNIQITHIWSRWQFLTQDLSW